MGENVKFYGLCKTRKGLKKQTLLALNLFFIFSSNFFKSSIYFTPIDDIPKTANIFCTIGFVLQKVRMFPHIQYK